MTSPPASTGLSAVFFATDVASLAHRVDIPLAKDAQAAALAEEMNVVLVNALSEAQKVRDTSPPGVTRSAFKQVASSGRKLLLSLDIEIEPISLAKLTWTQIAKESPVLRAMYQLIPDGLVTQVPPGIVAAYRFQEDTPEDAAKLAAQRYLMDVARAVGFLVQIAEASAPMESSSGERKNAFSPTILRGLSRVYQRSFGKMPELALAADGEADGPSLRWFGEVLRLASTRLREQPNQRQGDIAAWLDQLMAVEPETLRTYIVKATGTLISRDPK